MLPNGEYTTEKTDIYEVKENGKIIFIIQSNAGAMIIKEIVIENIDKEAPKGELKQIEIDGEKGIQWNIQDKLSGIKSIVLPNGQAINWEQGIYKVKKNGLYKFLIYDNVGNASILTIWVK